MPNIFFGRPKGDVMEFDDHETEHLKVVRMEEGQSLEVTDGKGIAYKVILRKLGRKKSYGDIIEAHRMERLPSVFLSLYVASSNWERLRFLLEKAVELGVDRIVVFKAERSKRDYTKKRKKLELVIRDSAKQCVKYLFPKLELKSSVSNLDLSEGEILVLDREGIHLKEIDLNLESGAGVVVGPESGFTDKELEFLSKRGKLVSLGRKTLRFETAGLASISLLAFEMGKI